MVSTRHHPKEFPEPDLPPSLSPTKSTTSSPSKRTVSTAATKPSKSARKAVTSVPKLPFASPIPLRSGYHTSPPLLIIWLLFSLPLVIWDTLYLLLRPYTMPGGKLHSPIWSPYALYGTVDYNYGWPAMDAGEGFPGAQACMNAVETIGYLWYFWKVYQGLQGVQGSKLVALVTGRNKGSKGCAEAVAVGFSVAIMTLSKTVLYWLIEFLSTPPLKNIGHNDFWTLFWIFILPNAAWIVIPSYMAWVFGREIVWGLKRGEESEAVVTVGDSRSVAFVVDGAAAEKKRA